MKAIPNLEEATSFIRHDLPSYVCMAGHRDLGLAAAQVLAWGKESVFGASWILE